jgi:signal peptidase II
MLERFWKLSILIIVILLTDWLSKGYFQQNYQLGESHPIIDGLFNLTYVQNTGAAFGMGGKLTGWGRNIVILGIPLIASIAVFVMMVKSLKEDFIQPLYYSLIFAGAIGNLYDRFFHGYVVDFLDFYWKTSHFPAFNVADMSISTAAGLIILEQLLIFKNKNKVNSEQA